MIKVVTEMKVRGYQLDMNGHVNNARFLEFLEEGRWEWSEKVMDFNKWQKKGIMFPVANININYRHPACLHDVLKIRTWLSGVGNASCIINQEILLRDTETMIVDAVITFVAFNSLINEAVSIAGDLLEEFKRLLE